MIDFNIGMEEDLRETIIKKVFLYIQNHYPSYDYSEWRDPNLVYAIEDILIKLESTVYYILDDKDYEGSIFGYKDKALENFTHTTMAEDIYQDIQPELKKFDEIRKNKEYHTDTGSNNNTVRESLLNTIKVTRQTVSQYQINKSLQDEIYILLTMFEDSIVHIDTHIDRYSNLGVYKTSLTKSGTNFLDKTSDDHFYPILVDFFIDYMRIMEIYNINQLDIKKYTNDYGHFRKRIQNKRLHISESTYFAFRFFKKMNKSEIKNYILAYYKRQIPNKELNTLFRKVFNIDNTNQKYRDKDMQNYLDKNIQLDIFIMGVYSKYFF